LLTYKKISIIILILIFFIFFIPFLYASETELFTYNHDFANLEKKYETGVYQINLTDDIFDLDLGDELNLNLNGFKKYILVHDKKTTHANGDITWIAHLKNFGNGYRTSLTSGAGVLYGRIMTPDGLFIITKKGTDLFLENPDEKGLILESTGHNDYLVRDASVMALRKKNKRVALMSDDGHSTIDLMIVYNQEMVNAYPGTSLQTKLNQLIALSNQAFIDSDIQITLRLVHAEQINYPNSNSNETALQALTNGNGVFSGVAELRIQYGADLVSLIRPYSSLYHNNCGIAWLNGLNGSDISLAVDDGFSVISNGEEGGYYCDDTTLVHELGHNMGSEHDRDHASYEGAYPYSYGYDRSGRNAFGTIMSYDGPTLNYFSNPDISECNGQPCGIDEAQINSANNALSMNNTRAKVAGFMAEIVTNNIAIYFPHIASNETWETEICIINTSSTTIDGTLKMYDKNGDPVSSDIQISLNRNARKKIVVGEELSSPSEIKYVIFETGSENILGYTKFYQEGNCRVAIPAISDVNSGDIYISHIASNEKWWTGVNLLNTTSSSQLLTIEFDDGSTRARTIAANEHQSFTIKSLFGEVSQSSIKSAVIRNANGIIGLELFGSTGSNGDNYLSGILLKDDTTNNIYYPHIASNTEWWTGVVAYNPSNSSCQLFITPYKKDGTVLSLQTLTLNAKEKYVGSAKALNFPEGSSWFKINSTSPITGFELFGTNDGKQLGGYTGVDIKGVNGVFAKNDSIVGWTGIAFVNIDNSQATVTLTAYNDDGNTIATESLSLAAFEKISSLSQGLFSSDISAATYIGYSSTGEVVGFQLNGSANGMMLDALPGM